jgi:ribosomal protein S18 acetylase RimI-like enzyme
MQKRPDMFQAFRPQTKEDEEIVRRVTGRERLTYDCRRASPEDVDTLLSITAQASAFLAQQGVSQWQDGFPNRDVFLQDIQAGNCWLFTHDGQPAGCVSLYMGPEPDYDAIQGQWLTQGDYGTVHRLAVAEGYRGRGLATEMLTFMEDLLQGLGYPSVRVDTHRDNQPMRKLLKKQGYTRCGVVYLTDTVEEDNRRVAYEKVFG